MEKLLNCILALWNQTTISGFERTVPRGHKTWSVMTNGNRLPRGTFSSPWRAFVWSISKV